MIQLTRRNALKVLGLGVVVGLASNLGCFDCSSKSRVIEPASVPAAILHSNKLRAVREEVVVNFLRDYLPAVVEVSPHHFKKLEDVYGKEGLVEQYASAHDICINFALDNIDREPSEKDYKLLGKKLADKETAISLGESFVKYSDVKVVESFASCGKDEIGLVKKLILASRDIEFSGSSLDYTRKVFVGAMTREQYVQYLSGAGDRIDSLYDAMIPACGVLFSLFAKKELKSIARVTREYYDKGVERFFPTENK